MIKQLALKHWISCLWNRWKPFYHFLEHFAYANYHDDNRNLISISAESLYTLNETVTHYAPRSPRSRLQQMETSHSLLIANRIIKCPLRCVCRVSWQESPYWIGMIRQCKSNRGKRKKSSGENLNWNTMNSCAIRCTYVQDRRRVDCRPRMLYSCSW